MSDAAEPAAAGNVTMLLRQLHQGDGQALDRLFPLIYDELRARARGALAREHGGHTLHATELVHEAFFKLAGSGGADWQDRVHFLAVAARAMRQVLVEHARRHLADKRGGGAPHVTLGDGDLVHSAPAEEFIALDDALTQLGRVRPRLRMLVEYRFFGGLSEREIAEALGVTERTVQRDWVMARAWLHQALDPRAAPTAAP